MSAESEIESNSFTSLEEFLKPSCLFDSRSDWPTDEQIEEEKSTRLDIKRLLRALAAEGCIYSSFPKLSLSRILLLINRVSADLQATEEGVIDLRLWGEQAPTRKIAKEALESLEIITGRNDDKGIMAAEAIKEYTSRYPFDEVDDFRTGLRRLWGDQRAIYYLSDKTVEELRAKLEAESRKGDA